MNHESEPLLCGHIQRIEDAYDSIQAMLDSAEYASYRQLLLQEAMKILSVVLEEIAK